MIIFGPIIIVLLLFIIAAILFPKGTKIAIQAILVWIAIIYLINHIKHDYVNHTQSEPIRHVPGGYLDPNPTR